MEDFGFAVGQGDFYHPMGCAETGSAVYRPSDIPVDWTSARSGIWCQWHPAEGPRLPDQGWKVHVTAAVRRAAPVLDTAARVLFAEGVAFKHLNSVTDFLVLNHKHAGRSQSGKFIAAYPCDEKTALRLMERLSAELAGESGPYVLTDRPFRTSTSVFYRYGAFQPRGKLRPDGTLGLTLLDGSGNEVPDRRGVGFRLPDGITDPFHTPRPAAPAPASPTVNGYTFEKVLRYSNAGGAYRARQTSTGRTVFIKEARPHAGLVSETSDAPARLRAEHDTLLDLHTRLPGLGLEPLEFFSVDGHDFLVTEFVDGTPLHTWNARHNPLIDARPDQEEIRSYYRTCTALLDRVTQDLDRMHAAGFAFLDLSPDNVLVLPDGTFRLIDFETATPVGRPATPVGTPGFFDTELARQDPFAQDRHALASLALYLLAPVNDAADRNPEVTAHLRRLLRGRTEPPPALWDLATRRHTRSRPAHRRAIRAADVDRDPAGALLRLRDDLVRGLLAAADPDDEHTLFPTVPHGYSTNTLSLEHGAAGVLYALLRTGAPVPAHLVDTVTRRALAQRDQLAPGLFNGTAGIARVLAEAGRTAEAHDLLTTAARHPLTTAGSGLAYGRAGVVLALLDLHHRTGDTRLLDLALSLRPGATGTGGLAEGDAGSALALHYLALLTGEATLRKEGTALLHEEMTRAVEDHGSLLFPMAAKDSRIVPYLRSGSAGIALVADRYARTGSDERVHTLAEGTGRALGTRTCVRGGLLDGLSGLGLCLADLAARTGDQAARDRALATAEALFLHAVPTDDGTHLLGGAGLRMSCDLGSGTAGALLFVHHALTPAPDALFTLDAQVEPTQHPGR
ncbi:class III lanthionine synthetase LanKC [Streptomyces sp. NPDC005805]|uniref:class III lanthionine synthetase LanKC n=1 Tax=Streptomyces sp. NPDC005805 TaxID=3157068 RepID=UPI00340C1AA5